MKSNSVSASMHRMYIGLAMMISMAIASCTKGGDATINPVDKTDTVKLKATVTDVLTKGGLWVTNAGTFYTGPDCTGSSTAATGEELGSYGVFALCGVTFSGKYAVVADYDANLPWSLAIESNSDGSTSGHIRVDFRPDRDDGDPVVNVKIVSINADSLVVSENTTFFTNYASYQQTLYSQDYNQKYGKFNSIKERPMRNSLKFAHMSN